MPDRNTAKPVPPLVPRTLRCANAALYAVSAVTLLAAGAWYVSTHENTAARVLAIAACLTGLLWTAYYCTLRITIDNQGVHRRTIFSQRSISWDFLSTWEIETSEDREQATCRLLFYSPDTPAPHHHQRTVRSRRRPRTRWRTRRCPPKHSPRRTPDRSPGRPRKQPARQPAPSIIRYIPWQQNRRHLTGQQTRRQPSNRHRHHHSIRQSSPD